MIRYVSVFMFVLFLLQELAICTLITVEQNESIQAAIFEARQGDTILVNAGVYYENLYLNKSIILQGIEMPVIEGGGKDQVITLSSGDSSLLGFEIRNSSKSSKDNGCVIITSDNNTIKNNIITNCSSGIVLFDCSDNIIYKNNFSNNEKGIYLQDGQKNKIANNNAIKNNYGIFLNNSSYNIIDANNASYNNYGIILNASNNNNITENDFIFSNKRGINLKYSERNYLTENNASSNKWDGIYIEKSNFNKLAYNIASFNDNSGVFLKNGYSNEISGIMADNSKNGIWLIDCRKNVLSGSIIKNNGEVGIRISNCTDSSFLGNNASYNIKNGIYFCEGNNNSFADNIVNYNKDVGIYLEDLKMGAIVGNNACCNPIGLVLLKSDDNTIKKNKAEYNDFNGISIESSHNNTIAGNKVSDNLYSNIIFLNSNKNSFANNTASNASAAIALQSSSNNTFFGNNASYNRIGMYLNRSNSSQIAENEVRNNLVGIALNFSEINLSVNNYLSNNKYNFLTNNNETNLKNGIWRETVISEHMERYLLTHDKVIVGIPNTPPLYPATIPSAKIISSGSPILPVSIESNPSGAEIWVDGESRKMLTPNKIILKRKGNHEIELFLSGYESKKETYYITSPTFIKINLIPLHEDDSLIKSFNASISSSPEGASIWVDGNFTGRNTPSTIYFDTAGNHTYELFLSGYEIFKGNINISESKSIKVRMIAKKFEGEPAEAEPLTESSDVPDFLCCYALLSIILISYFKLKSNYKFK